MTARVECVGYQAESFFDEAVEEVIAASAPYASGQSTILEDDGTERPCEYLLLACPYGEIGIITGVEIEAPEGGNQLHACYPFTPHGLEFEVTLDDIEEDCEGFEGVIHGSIAEGWEVSFFDTHYIANKQFYEPGGIYGFRLGALAYALKVHEPEPVTITDPKLVNEMRKQQARATGQEEGGDKVISLAPIELRTQGMAALFHVPQGLPDDYQFMGKVTEVARTEARGLAYLVITARVFHDRAEHGGLLPITVLESLVEGRAPVPGDDITGLIWLQGRMNLPSGVGAPRPVVLGEPANEDGPEDAPADEDGDADEPRALAGRSRWPFLLAAMLAALGTAMLLAN